MIRTLLLAPILLFATAAFAADAPAPAAPAPAPASPIKVLIITGDHGHNWKETTPYLKDLLAKAGMTVDVTETPSKDLTTENLAKYDVLFLNYKDTKNGSPESRWSDDNKKAFASAVQNGKGLVVYHHASSAFTSGEAWDKEYERIIDGGWRKQGFHGKRHEYSVKTTAVEHPITKGLSGEYPHSNDELYQNSLILPDSQVLVTAYSDPKKDPKNTGKDESMVWVSNYGKGRVVENALGHDVPAMQQSPIFQILIVRCTEWAATGDVRTPAPPAETLKPSPK